MYWAASQETSVVVVKKIDPLHEGMLVLLPKQGRNLRSSDMSGGLYALNSG